VSTANAHGQVSLDFAVQGFLESETRVALSAGAKAGGRVGTVLGRAQELKQRLM